MLSTDLLTLIKRAKIRESSSFLTLWLTFTFDLYIIVTLESVFNAVLYPLLVHIKVQIAMIDTIT